MHKIQTLPRLDKVVYDCIINNGIMNWDGTDLLNFLEAVGNKALTEHWNKKLRGDNNEMIEIDNKIYMNDLINGNKLTCEEFENYIDWAMVDVEIELICDTCHIRELATFYSTTCRKCQYEIDYYEYSNN